MSYSNEIEKELSKLNISIGHRISVEKDGKMYEGILMPKSAGDKNTLIIKLDNGYNIGIEFKNAKIKKTKGETNIKPKEKIKKYEPDKGKPTIAILHTGGTVASRIDYKTGAVVASMTPEEILLSIPELADIANIKTKTIFQMFSEDLEPEHWSILAKEIAKEIEKGIDGIIVTHGTDTMHYTSAALSFALQNLSIPVIIVGSQRSSDRGSSDAAMNLLCAIQFIAKTDFSGVAVCMHGTESDDFCYIISGVNVKKMHTSRRDTFRPIDIYPIAKVTKNGEIEFFEDYTKKDKTRELKLCAMFENNVAMLKVRPGFNYKELEAYENLGYKGIILEGTGLGHAPVNAVDKFTQHHKELLKTIERMTKKGIIIGMTSQCPYGRVNMNVYSTGRLLQEVGVIPLPIQSETAFVKLSWVLGHTKDPIEAKRMLITNYVGEIVERIDPRVFLF
ncbi:MAG: Glu-tRNA(Gln) amidotransferase subunit GatD [Candidatus Aenigmatarchaeota archaeon]